MVLEESRIHTIHIIGGTHKGKQNTQTRVQNRLYLTPIYIAEH